MRVAVIGLGTMGGPMARNLIAAGFSVTVFNRTRERALPFLALGAHLAESPREAAAASDVVLVCVSDTPDVAAVLLDESTGALSGLRSGALIIDCSTISPRATRSFAEAAAKVGVGYVDAPVSGGSEGAVRGTLAVMCGGSPEDFARALPVLQAVGKSITHVGNVGAGQVTKAVNQVIIAGIYQSVAEGITLARCSGLDPRTVLMALGQGAARSWVLENRASNMVEDLYPLGFRMRLHHKDLCIALETADEVGAVLSTAQAVAAVEARLIAEGLGDLDMSGIAKAVRRGSGLPDGPL